MEPGGIMRRAGSLIANHHLVGLLDQTNALQALVTRDSPPLAAAWPFRVAQLTKPAACATPITANDHIFSAIAGQVPASFLSDIVNLFNRSPTLVTQINEIDTTNPNAVINLLPTGSSNGGNTLPFGNVFIHRLHRFHRLRMSRQPTSDGQPALALICVICAICAICG